MDYILKLIIILRLVSISMITGLRRSNITKTKST